MEMVTVRTFDNYFSANILLGRLQEAGINCFLQDEHTVTIDPLLTNAIGGIKLQVSRDELSKVQTLLEAFDKEYLKSVKCPRCGANNILLVPKQNPGNFITAILTWLFSSYALAPEQVYQCQQCGYESKNLPDNPSPVNELNESE